MKERIISKIINKFMADNGLSINQFAKLCGISKFILKKLLIGNIKTSIINIIKVADVLGVKTNDLLIDYIYDDL